MAKKQNANVQNVSIEQNAEAQKPEVQNASQVMTLEVVKSEANDSGKTAPATIADVRQAFTVDVEKFRKAFADSAKADIGADNKTAVCAELFVTIKTWEELRVATRHAIYGYILGRAGKPEAENWFGLKKQSEHDLYKVAANAVKRAKDRAESKLGWDAPKAPNADVDRPSRSKTKPSLAGDLLSTLNTLINSDPEFTHSLSYVLASAESVTMFKAWARASAHAANNSTIKRAA